MVSTAQAGFTTVQAAPVWITGVGAVSCLGPDMDSLWGAALENRSGIRDGVGTVRDEWLTEVPAELRSNRALAFCVLAAREAMRLAGWTRLEPGDGLIFATTTGQILQWDGAFAKLVKNEIPRGDFRACFVHQPLGGLMEAVGERLGHDGPSALLTSACSASTQALALGAMWVRQGKVKRCLIAGAEVLCDLTVEGFRCLQLLSNSSSKPFDANRGGINLSEGAAFVCLEARSEKPLARISGFGYSTDGYHMTGPHPEGEGSYLAMRMALAKAGLEPSRITWAHAHGTGSQQNDLSEGLAMSRLFGAETPWVSSTKWIHGHALAASGALETCLLVRAIGEGRVLFTRGMETPDPKIPVKHPREDVKTRIHHVLKNTLGFGGANATLILSHAGEALA